MNINAVKVVKITRLEPSGKVFLNHFKRGLLIKHSNSLSPEKREEGRFNLTYKALLATST